MKMENWKFIKGDLRFDALDKCEFRSVPAKPAKTPSPAKAQDPPKTTKLRRRAAIAGDSFESQQLQYFDSFSSTL